MKSKLNLVIIAVAIIIFVISLVSLGAQTAQKPAATKTTTATTKALTKSQLNDLLQAEQQTITSALVAAHPRIATDYTINQGQLYDQGQWYGTTLTYKGPDTMNRDTLRVLMQKKSGVWTLRTTPPELLLAAKKYPDVPKVVLQSINKAISLPGTDTSPTVTANE